MTADLKAEAERLCTEIGCVVLACKWSNCTCRENCWHCDGSCTSAPAAQAVTAILSALRAIEARTSARVWREAADREAIARVIYEDDPFYESGEYVEGFQVSPGGHLSWDKARERDAEFSDDRLYFLITKYAYLVGDKICAIFRQRADKIERGEN